MSAQVIDLPAQGEAYADIPVCTIGSDNVLAELTSSVELADEARFLLAERAKLAAYQWALKYRTDLKDGEEEKIDESIGQAEWAISWATTRIRARMLALNAKSRTLGSIRVALYENTIRRCAHGDNVLGCPAESCTVTLETVAPYVHVENVRAPKKAAAA